MKTRVNSRINNVKGKAKNSFMSKKQGYSKVTIDNAIGYCLFHQYYIDKKLDAKKGCSNCPKFVKLAKGVGKEE